MDLKLNFKREKHFKKESSWQNLYLYWNTAICVVFVVAVAAMFFGYFLFTQVSKEFKLSDLVIGTQIETVKKDRIDKALEYFSLHQEKSTEIINSPSPLVDPSL